MHRKEAAICVSYKVYQRSTLHKDNAFSGRGKSLGNFGQENAELSVKKNEGNDPLNEWDRNDPLRVVKGNCHSGLGQ
jgi:hypothetical protein